nr:beta-1,3-galactosyltransferase 1-like [Lytechinus pictus]XP_054759593.1 beta-1,3-galactosyltransferase 1-like [Lytechinus pictus]
MRLWLKLRIWRSAFGRYIYLGLLGFIIMFGMRRTGGDRNQRRPWRSITPVGEDSGLFMKMASVNAIIVERENRRQRPFVHHKVEDSDHTGLLRDAASMPRLIRGQEGLKRDKTPFDDAYNKGTYLLEPTDSHTYTQLNTPRNICFDHRGMPRRVPMIIFVTSALGNLKRRDHIRVTYGNSQAWEVSDEPLVRTVFMLGATADPVLQAKISAEARIYGDIVQEDFIDSYLNLTRKTVMGLKWVTEHCRHAKFAMKIDDDTMLNKARILAFILRAPSHGVVIGNLNLDMPVVRSRVGDWGKYHISEDFYPASTYPPYLSGTAFIMSTDLVEATFRTALSTPLFPWEDVFMGMCWKKIGVSLMHDYHFMCTSNTEECYGDKEWPKYTVFVNLPAEYMVRVWVESTVYAEKQLPDIRK